MKSRTFDNGFRVFHQKSHTGLKSASIQVICDVGSIHEAENFRGAAHFIEHMCFKGTHKYTTSFEISTLIDKTGSYINAFTDKRYTKYYIDTTSENVPQYIHLLSDILLNSVFDKKEYEKEKAVVREEMIRDADDCEMNVLENADAVIYAGSPYEHSVDELKYHNGTHVLEHDKLVEMYKMFYIPSKMILSICSANSFNTICDAVSHSFFAKSRPASCPPQPILSLVPINGPVYKIVRAPINSIHLCIGFRTCSVYDKDRYILKMLKRVLSGSMSSRLFMILREENGLTYTSYASNDYYEHTGSFLFYAECDANKVFVNGAKNKPGVFPLIIQMICDLIKDGITRQELELAKSSYRGKMLVSVENADSIASYNAKNALFGIADYPEYDRVYEKIIKPLTVGEINNAIRKYFRRENMVVSIIGRAPPTEKMLEKYMELE
jgi:predicted Zn-dependent peptidase